jgi:aldose 1-epimerase
MKKYSLPPKSGFERDFGPLKSHLIILDNERGMQVALSDYGARIVSIIVPSNSGQSTDVVLGFDHIDKYVGASEIFHGVTVGRFANRLAGGRFSIDGKSYQVEPNNGKNALHGGKEGFHTKVWSRRVNDRRSAEFYLVSPDGDSGFPGNLTVSVQYHLTEENELRISYRAHTDQSTIINLTNHAFFNLNGEGSGSIFNHRLRIEADHFLPVDDSQIPTGEIRPVSGTPFDFTSSKTIGDQMKIDDEQLAAAVGFDHAFVLRSGREQTTAPAADILSPATGIRLQVFTDQPSIQLYTGNVLNGDDTGKSGQPYEQYGAFCLETQGFPDAPNHDNFPSCLLQPGEEFRSESVYKFSVHK